MIGDQLDRFVRQAYTISSKDSEAEKTSKREAVILNGNESRGRRLVFS